MSTLLDSPDSIGSLTLELASRPAIVCLKVEHPSCGLLSVAYRYVRKRTYFDDLRRSEAAKCAILCHLVSRLGCVIHGTNRLMRLLYFCTFLDFI